MTGRKAAVGRAKELSRKGSRTVKVEREDNAEELTFRGGSLDQYVFSTRGGRRR